MPPTYKATLRGNVLEWTGEAPSRTDAVTVQVTVVDEPVAPPSDADRGRRMAEALERIAARGGFPDIPDPVAWQREIRQDRPLPGREP